MCIWYTLLFNFTNSLSCLPTLWWLSAIFKVLFPNKADILVRKACPTDSLAHCFDVQQQHELTGGIWWAECLQGTSGYIYIDR